MKKILLSIFIVSLFGCGTTTSTRPQIQSKYPVISITVNNGFYDELEGMEQTPVFKTEELFVDLLKKFTSIDTNNASAEYKLIISYKEETLGRNVITDFASGVFSFVTLGFFPTTSVYVTDIQVLKKDQLLKTYTYRSNISRSNIFGLDKKNSYWNTISPICTKLISDITKDKILIHS